MSRLRPGRAGAAGVAGATLASMVLAVRRTPSGLAETVGAVVSASPPGQCLLGLRVAGREVQVLVGDDCGGPRSTLTENGSVTAGSVSYGLAQDPPRPQWHSFLLKGGDTFVPA